MKFEGIVSIVWAASRKAACTDCARSRANRAPIRRSVADGKKVLEAVLRETEPSHAEVGRPLRQALSDQRQVKPQPVERNEPQWDADELVPGVLDHPSRAVCRPTE